MARDDSPALAAARAAVGKALLEFAKVWRAEHGDDEPILEGWAATVTYTSLELAREDREGALYVVPTDQPRVLSCGLFQDAAKHY